MLSLRLTRRTAAALAVPVCACAIGVMLYLADANPAASQGPQLFAYKSEHDPGLDPADSAWGQARPTNVPLNAQLAAYPTGGGSVSTVTAQALHYNGTLYIRVAWADSTRDDSSLRVEQFSDAVAVEFPAKAATTVPSICMGQADAGVNIWQWRADSQAGHPDPAVSYPNAWVEEYPSSDPEFVTARAAGNPYALADGGPVQNLVASAFGTLQPTSPQDVRGNGVYSNGTWSVVFARPLTETYTSLVSFHESGATDMAFAVWNGSQGDRNGQKSVSAFVTLYVLAGQGDDNQTTTWLIAIGVLALLTVAGIGVAVRGYRQG